MEKLKFNDDWIFYNIETPENKQTVCLPHDAMIFEKRSPDNPSGAAGGFFPGGRYLYTKKFTVDKSQGEKWLLEFEGAHSECFVFLNGEQIAFNYNGYTNFYADLTDKLNFESENELEVRVDNNKIINSRWYTGSGLYRPVWLHIGGKIRIKQDGVRISTPDVSKDLSKVDIAISLINDGDETVKTRIETILTDKYGKIVCKESSPVTLFAKDEVTARQHLFLQNVKLWSIENPDLYMCQVRLLNHDTSEIDKAKSHFGIRKIQIDPYNGLRINGEKVLLRGACIHHDNGVIGAATYYDAAERRIRLLKEAGFNSIRISHHPCSKAMLDVCDRLGMLVFEESFDMWEEAKNKYDYSLHFEDGWKKDLEAMVAKDFNHPSVFIYCIGNEIKELAKDEGIRISRQLSEYVRQLDNTRPVTNAINGMVAVEGKVIPILLEMELLTKDQIFRITGNPDSTSKEVFDILFKVAASGNINDIMTAIADNYHKVTTHPMIAEKLEEIMSHLDVTGYNYMLSRYPFDIPKFPNRVLVGSETFPPEIDLFWEACKNNSSLIGDYTWTGWDYIGEAGVGHTNYKGESKFSAEYPGYLAYCGDIDITGYRRPLSYFREIIFGLRKTPYLSVQNPQYFNSPAKCTTWAVLETVESWTWKGFEGKPIRVIVYSADEEVILLINGKEAGKKRCERYQATFEIAYEPGVINAVGLTKGKQTASYSIKTATDMLQLQVNASKDTISCNDELCFVEIQLIDDSGVKYMNGDREVKVIVDGSAKLLGFGSGDPCSEENFFDNTRTTFNGRVLAVIRGTQKGTAKITISANGCENVKKEIKII